MKLAIFGWMRREKAKLKNCLEKTYSLEFFLNSKRQDWLHHLRLCCRCLWNFSGLLVLVHIVIPCSVASNKRPLLFSGFSFLLWTSSLQYIQGLNLARFRTFLHPEIFLKVPSLSNTSLSKYPLQFSKSTFGISVNSSARSSQIKVIKFFGF